MRIHRFVALVMTALALTMTSAHVLEMPPKLAYDSALYAAVNGSLYRYFAIVGGAYVVLAIVAVGTLAWRVRGRRSARWTLIAAIALVASFASWLVLVEPVNREIAATTDAARAWIDLRLRWEVGHLVGFVLWLAGFIALVLAILAEVPAEPRPVRARASRIIRAPRVVVMELYRDHAQWPQLFPATIRGVRRIGVDGATTIVEVDHRSAGRVPNRITAAGPDVIVLEETKPRYAARFANRFEPVPEGTRYTVDAEIQVRGALRALAWLAWPIACARLHRFVLDPMQVMAESIVMPSAPERQHVAPALRVHRDPLRGI